MSDDVREELEKIIEKAIARCESEAKEDWDAIVEEARNYEPEQEYASASEECLADDLRTMFESLIAESARTRYAGSREGLLNPLALASALTSRKCFNVREDSPKTPHVALLL